jgi:predicted MFS family arabinose efflux permease
MTQSLPPETFPGDRKHARFSTLAIAATAAHVADQLALALLPLILTVAGASAGLVSLVVATQAAAWLVMSLPAGVFADRFSRRTIMSAGAALIITGAAIGYVGASANAAHPVFLAAAGFLCSAGVVLQVMSVFALLPRLAVGHEIARANAKLEFLRATVVLSAPIAAGILVARGQGAIGFLIAVAAGLVSMITVRSLPHESHKPQSAQSIVQEIRTGARFVWQQPVLRAIALCALAWNSAFFAMTAALAPFARDVFGNGFEQTVGQAWACYGAGALLGAAVAPAALRRLPTGFLFVFGPASSLVGALTLVLVAPRLGTLGLYVGLFTLGFGPMVWLVLQTSVRQLLTPKDMLGRVAATLTTAIYGVRPIGAVAAGATATLFGTSAALWLATALFAVSVIAILRSPAPAMTHMPAG